MACRPWFSSFLAVAAGMLAFASDAAAFCDVLRYSANGSSERQALNRANRRGLVEVGQINRRYGNRVRYQPARWRCRDRGSGVRCTITQRYCVNARRRGGRGERDTCPGDSVRNSRGQCVKEDETVRANPCSGGRLFSQSREICHCPENRPVWTGRRCISARPTSGVSNRQIIQRCIRLQRECRTGLRGACRGLQSYCDRG